MVSFLWPTERTKWGIRRAFTQAYKVTGLTFNRSAASATVRRFSKVFLLMGEKITDDRNNVTGQTVPLSMPMNSCEKKPWQEAGFETYEGLLDRKVPPGRLWPPDDIALDDGDELFWTRFPDESCRSVEPSPGMLSEFVRLDHAPSEQILAYATKWGILGLDQNGEFLEQKRKDLDYQFGSEPISAWRNHAAQVRRALNLAAKIEGVDVPDSDWRDEYIDVILKGAGGPPFFRPYYLQQVLLNRYVNHWMREGEVHFRLSPPRDYYFNKIRQRAGWEFDPSVLEKGPQYSLQVVYGRGLFGALALQVCLAVTKSHGLYLCSGCGYPYLRGAEWRDRESGYPEQLETKRRNLTRRRPKKTTANYCEDCVNNRIPQKRAKAKYRAKQKT
jgi:hypothetical protein